MSTDTEATMQWQYDRLESNQPLSISKMNAVGKHGWELVSILQVSTGTMQGEPTYKYVHTFKRVVSQ